MTSSKGGGERLLSGDTKAQHESQEPLAFPGQGRQAGRAGRQQAAGYEHTLRHPIVSF